MTAIFVPGVGQYENIGDIMLRRELLSWLRPVGTLHVYVGPSPEAFAASLGTGEETITYRSFARWYWQGLKSAARGSAAYVFKPGEIQLTLVGMKEHLAMLPMLAVIRARGGGVVRVGSGSRGFARLPRLLIQPSILLSQLTFWRDPDTARYLGRGGVMPDLAFGEGSAVSELEDSDRDDIVVSMRGDRPAPSTAWTDGVRRFAAMHGSRLVVVTQVEFDVDRSRALAERLGATLLDWDGTGHGEQEELLREQYRRTDLVISDRLHVLIAAVTEGATPVALLVDESGKIDRHFAAAGLENVSVRAGAFSSDEIASTLERAVKRRSEVRESLAGARRELSAVRQEVERVLAGGSRKTR